MNDSILKNTKSGGRFYMLDKIARIFKYFCHLLFASEIVYHTKFIFAREKSKKLIISFLS